jgi:hypothetical protein
MADTATVRALVTLDRTSGGTVIPAEIASDWRICSTIAATRCATQVPVQAGTAVIAVADIRADVDTRVVDTRVVDTRVVDTRVVDTADATMAVGIYARITVTMPCGHLNHCSLDTEGCWDASHGLVEVHWTMV